jgi:hypothetical protein
MDLIRDLNLEHMKNYYEVGGTAQWKNMSLVCVRLWVQSTALREKKSLNRHLSKENMKVSNTHRKRPP